MTKTIRSGRPGRKRKLSRSLALFQAMNEDNQCPVKRRSKLISGILLVVFLQKLKGASMRRLFALTLFFLNAVLLGPLSAASGAMSEPSWRLFKYKPGHFRVEMPGKPQRMDTRTKSFIGTITTHVFIARSHDEEYTVSYADLPGFAVKFAGSATIYSNAKGALLMETLGKEQRFEDATLNGIQGKSLVYDMPDPQTNVDMRGAAYFFLVEKRMYVIDVNVPLGEIAADGPHFFSSFRLE